jgi:hypothetical protein
MSQEIAILILIIAGVIVFAFLRRSTELPTPKAPSSESVTGAQTLPAEDRADLVLITHPVILRAAERVLTKGGEAAKYVTKDGDRIYFSFDRIEDPVQRRRALDLIKGIQTGQDVNISEVLQLVRRMFNE